MVIGRNHSRCLAGSELRAAVDPERVAGDPASRVGRQEGDGAGDVLGLSLRACMPRVVSRPASVLVKLDISVATTPGATPFTRMPRGPRAAAKWVTGVSSAPLVDA